MRRVGGIGTLGYGFVSAGPRTRAKKNNSRVRNYCAFRRERGQSLTGRAQTACYHPAMKKPVVLLAAALFGGCAAAPQPQTPESALNALVEEYFERQLELSPMSATAIGDTRFDDRLDETTSPDYRARQ